MSNFFEQIAVKTMKIKWNEMKINVFDNPTVV